MAFIAAGAAIVSAGIGASGASKDRKSIEAANETAQRQRAESMEFINSSIKQNRGDLFKLFPSAQESLQTGMQASMDIFNQAFPEQLRTFQQGNMGAQNQIIAGHNPQMAAILGQPINYNPQATQIQAPQLQGRLPEFGSISDLGLDERSPMEAGGGAGSAMMSGQLIPHKGHYHPPGSNEKIMPGGVAAWMAKNNPQPQQQGMNQQQGGVQQQLAGIDPALAQQLIAEYQASQQGGL